MTVVYVHGGVSGVERDRPSLAGAIVAAEPAGSALDAVELAVVVMEDDPALNAGFGSVLNRDGRIELDAGIADGSLGRCGAVAATTVKNPIRLARRVLEDTPHVLLAGDGADALGGDMPTISGTEAQRRRWQAALDAGRLKFDDYAAPEQVDTVGAVALDDDGRLAAGSSTGGVFGQLPGRVGDAPVFGAGLYASESAAVVGTGVGELFLQTLASARVGRLIEQGHDPQRACEQVIEEIGKTKRFSAGLLALDRTGRVGAACRGAMWAVEGPAGSVPPVFLD